MAAQRKPERMPIVTEEELPLLETFGRPIRRPKKNLLFAEGETDAFTLYIRKGYVAVKCGDPEVIVAVRGPGETVGEMAFIDGEPRSASVYAAVDIEALYLDEDDWRRFLYRNPRSFEALLQEVTARLRESTAKQREIGQFSADRRLASRLAELTDKIGEPSEDGSVLVTGFSQNDLAGYAGISRKAATNAISRLVFRGVVVVRGREKIIIRHLDQLREVALGKEILD